MTSKHDSDRTGAAGAGPAGRRIMKQSLLVIPNVDRAGLIFFLNADRACRSVYAPVVPLLRHWTSFGPNRGAREGVWASEAAAFGSLPRLSRRWSSRHAGRKRIASR